MRPALLTAFLVFATQCTATSQVNRDTPGYFPFWIPAFDETPSFTDMAFLNPEPAGASGRVTVHGGHFYDARGVRLRLFGSNLTFAGAFPEKEEAPRIAGHLRKLGLNVIRFHHMDGQPAPDGLWLPDFSGFDAEQLDKLDWLIFQLKQHGIYTNLNLHVSRTYPGMPKDGLQGFQFGKGLDNFYPPFIQLQKDYARDLLRHRNPYTKTTYAEEPAVVVIELNNENAMTAIPWDAWRVMPEPYRGVLKYLWLTWRADRGKGAAHDFRVPAHEADVSERGMFYAFLQDTECRYLAEMRRYLQEDLGVQACICGTQASYGDWMGLYREGTYSDFLDGHAYWQHPRFPGRPWDKKNWSIDNTSMVADPDAGALGRLAWLHCTDKPFTVSEYDHPFPNDHAVELFPLAASFAAFQDWDGIYQFNYRSRAVGDEEHRLASYFELWSHPGKQVFLPIAALMYRMGAVRAGNDPLVISVPTGDLPRQMALETWNDAAFRPLAGVTVTRPVGHRLTSESGSVDFASICPAEAPYVSNTGEIRWDTTEKRRATYTVNASAVRAALGYIGGTTLALGDVSIRVTGAEEGWAAVAIGALDGKPVAESSRILVVAAGRVENSTMGWNRKRSTVGDHMGTAPIVVEGIEATIQLPVGGNVDALDGTGTPKADVAFTRTATGIEFRIGPQYHTLWYGVTP